MISTIDKLPVFSPPETSQAFINMQTHGKEILSILRNIHSVSEKAGISVENFSLNDSFNNKFNTPIYMKFIKSVNNEGELRNLKSEFQRYTDEYKKNMEDIYNYVRNSSIYDNNTGVMCQILSKRYLNINNYLNSFEKKIPDFMKITTLDTLLNKIRSHFTQALAVFIKEFTYQYCLDNNNELSHKLINAFNKYLKNLGVSTFNAVTGKSINYDFYEVNEDSNLYITNDMNKMDVITNIHHYAYVFANNSEDVSQMSVIAKGDASVYCYCV